MPFRRPPLRRPRSVRLSARPLAFRSPSRRAVRLGAFLLVAAAGRWHAAPPPPTVVPPPAEAPPSALEARLEPLVPRLAAAAAHRRRGDCAAARREIAALAREGGAARLVDLVAGLYAHACDDPAAAAERLAAAEPPGGAGPAAALEDWRLLVLADSAAATGRRAVAEQALAALLASQPASPLRPAAFVEAARLAAAAGDRVAVAAVAEQGRAEGIEGEPRQRLELLAWEAARAAGDTAALAAAARGLLVHDPAKADEVGVLGALAPAGVAGAPAVAWGTLLSADELARRAEALLAAGRPDPALVALAAVPPSRRDVDWQLAAARAEVAAQRGLSALLRLRDVDPADNAARARVDWQRAAAAREAVRVRRGRDPLPADERDRLRQAAAGWLERVAAQRADRGLAARALAELFAEYWDAGRVEPALAALARLREVDPGDATGARKLWEAGWNQYQLANYSGAVGWWAELAALYAGSSYDRAGRYWTARAFEGLGKRDRATAIYRAIAAGEAADFYVRHARARVGGAAVPESLPLAADRGIPWPEHPDLARARLLSDLGLDSLAASELAAVAGRPAPEGGESRRRAAAALEALILARRGQPRSSIRRIHDAFPALGGPFQAAVPAAALRLYYPLAFEEVIAAAARRQGLPPHLVLGMVRQESAFDLAATSHAGARGLMQLMPATAREVAKKIGVPYAPERLADPSFNVTLGTSYFHQVLGMFDGNVELALAGYNGGPYRIRRLWREAGDAVPLDAFVEGLPVEESRIYTKRILLLADSYRQLYAEAREPG
ncbi:MAG TPA: lytic transglycosylase domain-containing protein [Thermoanaerobaculia bacterium]